MIELRKSQDRGGGDHGWLQTQHSFSFADYYDPRHMGFRSLRVINEDHIAPGRGFGTHPHHDMEIITYVIKGALEHKDSMGNQTRILPGEVQRMTAGTGVTHSEYNPNLDQETHLLQIWILPREADLKPGYGQESIADRLARDKFILAVSGDGRDGSIPIAQDADLYIGRIDQGQKLDFKLKPGRHAWIQLIKGELAVNDQKLQPGDGLAASDEKLLKIAAEAPAEFLLFDLA